MTNFNIKIVGASERDLENLQIIVATAYEMAKQHSNTVAMSEADAWGYVVRQNLEDMKDEENFTFI